MRAIRVVAQWARSFWLPDLSCRSCGTRGSDMLPAFPLEASSSGYSCGVSSPQAQESWLDLWATLCASKDCASENGCRNRNREWLRRNSVGYDVEHAIAQINVLGNINVRSDDGCPGRHSHGRNRVAVSVDRGVVVGPAIADMAGLVVDDPHQRIIRRGGYIVAIGNSLRESIELRPGNSDCG